MDDIFSRLERSKFRSGIHLNEKEKIFVVNKGMQKIGEDAYDILDKKIRIKRDSDGKQTPWHGHPVFVAQHGTATCCRKCIEKWYKIPQNKVLDERETKFFLEIILRWIEKEAKN
jgi:hypothetical protein